MGFLDRVRVALGIKNDNEINSSVGTTDNTAVEKNSTAESVSFVDETPSVASIPAEPAWQPSEKDVKLFNTVIEYQKLLGVNKKWKMPTNEENFDDFLYKYFVTKKHFGSNENAVEHNLQFHWTANEQEKKDYQIICDYFKERGVEFRPINHFRDEGSYRGFMHKLEGVLINRELNNDKFSVNKVDENSFIISPSLVPYASIQQNKEGEKVLVLECPCRSDKRFPIEYRRELDLLNNYISHSFDEEDIKTYLKEYNNKTVKKLAFYVTGVKDCISTDDGIVVEFDSAKHKIEAESSLCKLNVYNKEYGSRGPERIRLMGIEKSKVDLFNKKSIYEVFEYWNTQHKYADYYINRQETLREIEKEHLARKGDPYSLYLQDSFTIPIKYVDYIGLDKHLGFDTKVLNLYDANHRTENVLQGVSSYDKDLDGNVVVKFNTLHLKRKDVMSPHTKLQLQKWMHNMDKILVPKNVSLSDFADKKTMSFANDKNVVENATAILLDKEEDAMFLKMLSDSDSVLTTDMSPQLNDKVRKLNSSLKEITGEKAHKLVHKFISEVNNNTTNNYVKNGLIMEREQFCVQNGDTYCSVIPVVHMPGIFVCASQKGNDINTLQASVIAVDGVKMAQELGHKGYTIQAVVDEREGYGAIRINEVYRVGDKKKSLLASNDKTRSMDTILEKGV